METMATQPLAVRGLMRTDLADVVAIDTSIEGRSRRDYVQQRLAAALRDPALHAQFAALDADGLAGYILARVLEGEFGRDARSLRLELVGVRPDAHHHGVGARLFDALVEWAGRHAIGELRTQAAPTCPSATTPCRRATARVTRSISALRPATTSSAWHATRPRCAPWRWPT